MVNKPWSLLLLSLMAVMLVFSQLTTGVSASETVTPGTLTIVKDAIPNAAQAFTFSGDNGLGNFTLVDDDTPAPSFVNASINFQHETSEPPIGYMADVGYGYSTVRGYGWITEASIDGDRTPIDIRLNARDRNRPTLVQELDTLIHMQYPGGDNGIDTPAAWEYALAPGEYTITVSVGDEPNGAGVYDSIHHINVEGQPLIEGFVSEQQTEFLQATTTLYVTDGHLTVDAIGGTNTKINYVLIQGTPAPANTQIFTGIAPGTYTITENAVDGWSYAGASCSGAVPQLTGTSLTIEVTSGADIVCTFTNTEDPVIPTTIQQIAPVGTIDSGTGDPDYTWEDIGATAYEIYIEFTNRTLVYNAEIDAGDICVNDICTFDPTTVSENHRLYNNNYRWYVRDIDSQNWAGPVDFTLAVPLPLLPENVTVENADTLYPTFTWTVDPATSAGSATYFNVVVREEGVTVMNEWVLRDAACGTMTGTDCAFVSTVQLEDQKNHTVSLTSYGIGGLSNGYTTPVAFQINVPRPQPLSPNGVIDSPSGNPVYTWTDLPDTPYYYIYVGNSVGAQVINEVVSDVGYCDGTQCQFDATTLRESYRLSPGTYTFFVRGWREGSPTPWSSGMTFTVQATPPAVPTKLAPEAGGGEAGPQVTFRWTAVANALWYDLPLVAPNGEVLSNTGMVGDEITCANDTCEWTLTLPEINGVWSWYLRALNVGSASAWSEGGATDNYGVWTFGMPVEMPGVVTKLTPDTTLDSPDVIFEWEADAVASLYELYIAGPNGYVLYERYTVGTDVTCDTTCSLPLTMPTTGNYTWYLRAGNAAGYGLWLAADDPAGGAMTFSIDMPLPDVVEIVQPTAQETLDTLDVPLTWAHEAGGTRYEVYVGGPNGYEHHQTYVVGTDITCGVNCEETLTVPANGNYTWYVRAGNAAGWGAWLPQGVSRGVTFTVSVDMPELPGIIQNPSPAVGASLSDLATTFSWDADEQATYYEIYIAGPNNYVHYQAYTVADLNCDVTCSLPLTLPTNGAYTWYVRGGNDTGWGLWIAEGAAAVTFTFTMDVPLPALVAMTSPAQGTTLDSLAMAFTWDADPNATIYEIYVSGPTGEVLYAQYDAASHCNINCVLQQTLPVDGNYVWYMRGGNDAGWGAWSTGVSFTVDEPTLPAVQRQSPAQNATLTDVNVTLTWSAVDLATVYEVAVNGSSGNVHHQSYVAGTDLVCNGTCSISLALPANDAYIWYVRAGNSNGFGPWGPDEANGDYGARNFTVNMPLPAAPVLVSPADDGIVSQTNRPTFTWNAVNTALWYNIELIDGRGGVTFTQWIEASATCAGGTCSLQLPNPILYGGYSWRVQAYNPAGVGAWSMPWDFLTLSINLQPMMVQVEDTRITRSGTWTTQSNHQAMGASYLQSTTSTADTLTMHFSGSAVDVVYVAGPQYGTFVVEIDGQPVRYVDANAAQVAYSQVASFGGLAEGEHTLRIVPLGGAPVAVDALVVNGEVLTAVQPAPVETETPSVEITD